MQDELKRGNKSPSAQPEPGFFDRFPRFYETGNTPPGPRLNARYEVLIERHREHLEGRSVLDVGSHDGRWSFAALEAGASHVTGIEPRTELVDASIENMRAYGVPEDRFEFRAGDALDALVRQPLEVETVFLFGVLYHVYYHVELFRRLWQTGASVFIVDTHMAPTPEWSEWTSQTVSYRIEGVEQISSAADEIVPGSGIAIIGHPSRAFLRFLFRVFELNGQEVDWTPYLEKWGARGMPDYESGKRATFLAVRRERKP